MSTLQSCPESTLAKMFSPSSSYELPEKDSTGAYFIDSSPVMFGYVLDWCRYKKLIVDKEGESVDWEGLEGVADYFGLLGMKSEVTERKKKVEKQKGKIYVDLECRGLAVFRLRELTSGIRDINYE